MEYSCTLSMPHSLRWVPFFRMHSSKTAMMVLEALLQRLQHVILTVQPHNVVMVRSIQPQVRLVMTVERALHVITTVQRLNVEMAF